MYVCMFIVFARSFVFNKSKNFKELLPEIYSIKKRIILGTYVKLK